MEGQTEVEIQVDETKLILEAISNKNTPRNSKRKKVLKDVIPYDVIQSYPDESDAIVQLVKEKNRKEKNETKWKKKSISQWTNTDFLKYISSLLSPFGISVHRSVRDKDMIGRIYDSMLSKIPDKMSNHVLKQYLEWWVNVNSSYLNDAVYIGTLLSSKIIDKFLIRFEDDETFCTDDKKGFKTEDKDNSVTPEILLKMGGLSMCLCSVGIVKTYELLKSLNESHIIERISKSLRNLSEDGVKQSLNTTIKLAPYKTDPVDFISIARAAIEYYGIKDFKGISYKDHF